MQSILGSISTKEFLENYWEQKPLLIKNAIKDIASFAKAGDLKELSYDEDFESRIVFNNEKETAVKHGPLSENDFDKKGWTLVCHNLNLLDENFAQLEQALSFLPHWLFDDVMATYSQKDATIGAHIDKYNVFIVQAQGKRKWQLQTNPDPTYKENLDIKILKNFTPEIEWILEPGDMIYIPSNTAHCGTSLSESISYSLGFKSLETETILKDYLSQTLMHIEAEDYLKDTTRLPVKDPYKIDPQIIDFFFKQLQNIVNNKEQFKYWLTSHLSQPKTTIEPGETYIEEEIIELNKVNSIFKDVHTKVSSFEEKDFFALSINENLYRLEKEDYLIVSQWFMNSPFTPIKADFDKLNNDTWPLIIDLFKNGTFYFSPKD